MYNVVVHRHSSIVFYANFFPSDFLQFCSASYKIVHKKIEDWGNVLCVLFGCESSPISRNVRASVSPLVRPLVS